MACASVGLPSNPAKTSITPRRLVDPSTLPAGFQCTARPVVLRHGAPDVPVLPANAAALGSQLAGDSPEVTKL
eukprot:1070117-Alexandrium_andersonii.AAC.1